MSNKVRIPKRFKLFATTVEVVWDNKKCDDLGAYGQADYGSSQIILATTNGAYSLSKDKIIDTYYHERTHHILNAMQETELCKNEKFVDVFSQLLRQSIESEEYE
jgi:rRNA pseudouridine-1189 N-methylase Emg1 (Nep1/Mra1 family)